MLPKISLAEARSTQNEELARFREFVPQDIIAKDYGISPPSEAMSCNVLDSEPINSDGGLQLAGRWRALTPADVDLDTILDEIRSAYEAKPGWTATVDVLPTEASPSKLVVVTSPEKYQYLVRISTEPDGAGLKTISVASFSPCIQVPTDFDIDAQY